MAKKDQEEGKKTKQAAAVKAAGKRAAKKKAAKKKAAKKRVARKKAVRKAAPKRPRAPTGSAGQAEVKQISPRDRYEMIAKMAYFRAEKRGFEPGWEQDDWLESERLIDEMLSKM